MTTVNQERLEKEAQTTNRLDVTAHGTIREGKLEQFKRHAAEMIRQTKEKDTKPYAMTGL